MSKLAAVPVICMESETATADNKASIVTDIGHYCLGTMPTCGLGLALLIQHWFSKSYRPLFMQLQKRNMSNVISHSVTHLWSADHECVSKQQTTSRSEEIPATGHLSTNYLGGNI